MATIRGFSWSGPEVQVLTCPLPFLRGRLSFRPNIFRSNGMKMHESFKQFKIPASKNHTDTSDGENTQNDLKNPKKKSAVRDKKKSTKETSEETSEDVELIQPEENQDPNPSKDRKKRSTKKSDKTGGEDSAPKFESVLSELSDLVETTRQTQDPFGFTEDDTWRPLICCFGPAKHLFIPYARPATRILDHKIHEYYPRQYWSPDRFFRAPGSSANRVAIMLAREKARVQFIGKFGNDSLGMNLLYVLIKNGVKTWSVKRDDSRRTAVSYMKLVKNENRGGLRAECVKKCAEDCFSSSDIDEDNLKEVKMLYFNSSSLLDPDEKSTLMEVINITKSSGGKVFFDANIPLPLWRSHTETKSLLQDGFSAADFIELTSQELDFLRGIKEEKQDGFETVYDKRTQDEAFGHVESEEVKKHFWHDGLTAIFVTDGTSRIHYYTEERDGFVRGTEDIEIEPASREMSASGDGVIAALMRMLVDAEDPDLITDPGYLEENIYEATRCGLWAQFDVTLASGWLDSSDSDEESEEEGEGGRVEEEGMAEEEKEKELFEFTSKPLY